MNALRIVVLEGDQTGQELLEQALRVIDSDVIGLDLELERFDLSLENRRRTQNEVCIQGAKAMVEAGFGIKAATIGGTILMLEKVRKDHPVVATASLIAINATLAVVAVNNVSVVSRQPQR